MTELRCKYIGLYSYDIEDRDNVSGFVFEDTLKSLQESLNREVRPYTEADSMDRIDCYVDAFEVKRDLKIEEILKYRVKR
jgi:hypothetical protein